MCTARGLLAFAFDHSDAVGLPVQTERLRLMPATSELVKADFNGRAALADALAVDVPHSWPPKFVPDPDSADGAAWWTWFVVRRRVGETEPRLVGFGGIKGWSPVARTVQMGCAFLDEDQAQGYAPETLEAMVRWAFSQSVDSVIIDVPSGHAASVKVLARIGFMEAGPGSSVALTRYERRKT